MKRYASELEFVSQIKADGSGVEPVDQQEMERLGFVHRRQVELTRLSISKGTYITHGFGSYIVKLKNPQQ